MSGWMLLLVTAHPGSPGQRAIKRSCVCVCNTDSAVVMCSSGHELTLVHAARCRTASAGCCYVLVS